MGTPPACAPLRWRRRIHRSGITRRPAERKAGLSAVRGIYYVRFHHWYRAFKGSRSGNLVDKLINDVWFNWWLMVNGLIEGNISTKAGSFAPKYTVVIFVDNLVRTKCLKMFLEPLLFHPNLSKPHSHSVIFGQSVYLKFVVPDSCPSWVWEPRKKMVILEAGTALLYPSGVASVTVCNSSYPVR